MGGREGGMKGVGGMGREDKSKGDMVGREERSEGGMVG